MPTSVSDSHQRTGTQPDRPVLQRQRPRWSDGAGSATRLVTSRKKLLFGALAAGIVALSIYAFMLQGLHVPYPADFPKTGWPAFLALVPVVLGTVWLTALAWPRLRAFPLAVRYPLSAGLVAMVT